MVKLLASLPAIILASALLLPVGSAATSPVELGTADAFAILAGTGITNAGVTTVRGDVGSHPTASQTGFGPGANTVTITGTNHHDDAVTQSAKAALVMAYDDAAGRSGGTPIPSGELGGRVLTPGLYKDNNDPASLQITGTLVLDGLNDPDSVFIFQSDSTLVTASHSNVQLTRGAQACHVFWSVGSSATLGTTSHFEGTILALTSIALDHGATVNGRVLARNGAVTMDMNSVQIVPCAPAAPTPTPTPPSHPSVQFFPDAPALVLGIAGATAVVLVVLRLRRP
jgi:hypothetical protein